jgi:hypothetical protein
MSSSSRFTSVAPRVGDTGPNVLRQHIVTPRGTAMRRDEVFSRVSPKELYRLVVSTDVAPVVERLGAAAAAHQADDEGTLRVVTTAAGDRVSGGSPAPALPFLLLDTRDDREAYDRAHLLNSLHCPRFDIMTRDRIPIELHTARRLLQEVLVVSDSAREAEEVATKLVRTGYAAAGARVLNVPLAAMLAAFPLAFDGPEAEAAAAEAAAAAATENTGGGGAGKAARRVVGGTGGAAPGRPLAGATCVSGVAPLGARGTFGKGAR